MIAKLLAIAAAAFILSKLFPGLGGFGFFFKSMGGFGGGVNAMKDLGGLNNMATGVGGVAKFGGLVAEVSGDKLNFVMNEYTRKAGN